MIGSGLRGLLVAVGFMTRIPVPPRVFGDARAQALSLAWYPAVGLLLGAVLLALAWALSGLPPLLQGALLLLAWTGLTGAMHLDGLADSADAWVGGMAGDVDARRERTLAIMKDPRCGPVGVVVLGLLLLLKFAALASLPATAWPALLLAPLLARAVLVPAFTRLPYLRRGGLGAALPGAPRAACVLSLLASVAVCAAAGWRGVLAIAVAALVYAGWRRACLRRLGGITGDTAGALIELVEAAVLVALVSAAAV